MKLVFLFNFFRVWKKKPDAVPTVFDSSQKDRACGPPPPNVEKASQRCGRKSAYQERKERDKVSNNYVKIL
jgi:hypothetical protein